MRNNRVPKILKDTITSSDQEYAFLQMMDQIKNKTYSETAAYGDLGIDEMNGLFQTRYKREAVTFSCLDIEQIGIYCVKPKADRNNSVYCDVEFNCVLTGDIRIKYIIKSRVNCPSKRKNTTELTWEEPGDMAMFRTMFNQMYKNAVENYNRKVQRNLISKNDIERIKAEALFMIDSEYSETELNQTRDKLLTAFSGDEDKELKINAYYSLLK